MESLRAPYIEFLYWILFVISFGITRLTPIEYLRLKFPQLGRIALGRGPTSRGDGIWGGAATLSSPRRSQDL